MILAGDIGGTNTRLAVFQLKSGRLSIRRRQDFTNAGRRNLAPIVKEFLEAAPARIEAACFGVAGPVQGGKVAITNLNWKLNERGLARALRIRKVALINDLVAHAEGVNTLLKSDLVTLHRGVAVNQGNRAVLAPGTGLGEAGLVFDSRTKDYRAFPSEGGHADFSPRDAREDALLRYMRQRLGRCSWEDVLSGPGLKHIYEFLSSPGEFHVASAHPGQDVLPQEISAAACSGECPAAVAAVEMLASFYGSEAGNLALKVLATGGVYIGGGIAPHLLRFLRRPDLRAAFTRKGPKKIQKLLSTIPIHVITSTDGALFGAAHYARRL